MARLAAKRALDIAGSAACLVAFGPLFLCVAAAVKLTSKGPVFFRQQRVGEAGQPFTMFKFRTMQVNCGPRASTSNTSSSSFNPISRQPPATGAVFKLVNDPRVTPVGDFLRRSSLDELPQFWNVLRGDMSLVGPRPPLPYEVARYKPWHRRRVLEAKPGITGLWQVTGRSRTTFDDMVRLDLRYAKNCSVWTDLKILLATPRPWSRARARAERTSDTMDYVCDCCPTSSSARTSSSRNSSTCTAARSATRPRLAPSSRSRRTPRVGRRCKISSHTFICEGVTIEDHVFIGHGVMFINDSYPRATTAGGELQTEPTGKSSRRS